MTITKENEEYCIRASKEEMHVMGILMDNGLKTAFHQALDLYTRAKTIFTNFIEWKMK